MSRDSTPAPGKRTARLRTPLTARAVEALQPEDKPYTAWDSKLTGFGVRVQPPGLRSDLVVIRRNASAPQSSAHP